MMRWDDVIAPLFMPMVSKITHTHTTLIVHRVWIQKDHSSRVYKRWDGGNGLAIGVDLLWAYNNMLEHIVWLGFDIAKLQWRLHQHKWIYDDDTVITIQIWFGAMYLCHWTYGFKGLPLVIRELLPSHFENFVLWLQWMSRINGHRSGIDISWVTPLFSGSSTYDNDCVMCKTSRLQVTLTKLHDILSDSFISSSYLGHIWGTLWLVYVLTLSLNISWTRTSIHVCRFLI